MLFFLYEESVQVPRRGRTSVVKLPLSVFESVVAFNFTWAVNQDQLVNGSFKKRLFLRLGDEEEDLPNKSVFTGIDFRHFRYSISDVSVVAGNTPVASGAKIDQTGTESCAIFFSSKGLVARYYPEGVKLLSL